jgi:hypothetical protein
MTHAKTAALNGHASFSLVDKLKKAHQNAPTLLELFWVFVIASIVGLVAETVVSYFADGRWESRAGLVWGPFSSIYGLGAVIMTMFLWPLERRPVWLFIGAAILGGTFEYVAGWFWETYYGIVAWSYADQPFNIGGHTCLAISLAWGAAGVLWFRFGYPPIKVGIAAMPKAPRRIITTIMAVFIFTDIVVTIMAFGCWFDRLSGIPVETAYQQFFATNFDNDFMSNRFETMSVWTSLATNHH